MFNKTRSFISGILLGFYLTSLTLTSGLQSGGTTAQGINDGLVYVVGEDGAKIFYDATSVIGAGALVKGGIKGAVKSIGKKNPTGQLDEVIEQGAKSTGSFVDDVEKSTATPIGRKGNPIEVAPGTNKPAVIDNRSYSGHALDQMQSDGIMPSVVKNTIDNTKSIPGNKSGTDLYYDPINDISVVTNSSTGNVVTVSRGRLREGK